MGASHSEREGDTKQSAGGSRRPFQAHSWRAGTVLVVGVRRRKRGSEREDPGSGSSVRLQCMSWAQGRGLAV
eukprot:1454372-Rhodomonas_salina.1